MTTPTLSAHEGPEHLTGDYDDDLSRLQEKLGELMVGHIVHKKRSVVVLEGWDAAGKGGAIKRLTAQWDPRSFSVWPISAPTADEKAHHYLWRFWKRLPGAGEISVFDRSWYGRVLVERVEGFASPVEWQRAYREINEFEAQLAADGTAIAKVFLHISSEVQDDRLKARLSHPWKKWKVGPEDFRNRARRDDYTAAIEEMLAKTNTESAPWIVVNGNKKKPARLAVLQAVHDRLRPNVPPGPPEVSEEVIRLAGSAFGRSSR